VGLCFCYDYNRKMKEIWYDVVGYKDGTKDERIPGSFG